MRYGWINFHIATITAWPKREWKLGWWAKWPIGLCSCYADKVGKTT